MTSRARGEKQAVEIFLSDLGRLQRDIIGMARYRVLLRAGLVEEPRVSFANAATEGGRARLSIGDRTVRITDQPGLQANRLRWQPARDLADERHLEDQPGKPGLTRGSAGSRSRAGMHRVSMVCSHGRPSRVPHASASTQASRFGCASMAETSPSPSIRWIVRLFPTLVHLSASPISHACH